MTTEINPNEMDTDYERAAGGRERVTRGVPHVEPSPVAVFLWAILRYGWPFYVALILFLFFG